MTIILSTLTKFIVPFKDVRPYPDLYFGGYDFVFYCTYFSLHDQKSYSIYDFNYYDSTHWLKICNYKNVFNGMRVLYNYHHKIL